jgi:hypothetical protein
MFALALLVLLGPAFAQSSEETVRVEAVLPAGRTNAHYRGNREPLSPAPLIRLPVGTVRPEGWVREQLTRMAAGFTGRLPEVSRFCQFQGNAWSSPEGRGQFGWEEVPYWLKGFVDLGYVLNDPRIIAQSKKWIDAVLATQRPDGYFGSASNLEESYYSNAFFGRGKILDLWPAMVMLYPLRTYYEATHDERIPRFMLRYFQWVNRLPLDQYLPESWQKWRGGDQLEILHWLYNETGETWLLDLARITHERTADWVGGIPTWHGVNLSQGFREPAQYSVQARDKRYLDATGRNYDTIMNLYGQAPGGMFGADENARPGFSGPRQGAESCSMVEMMNSGEMLLRITGQPLWADRVEDVAFNSLPAATTPDLKALHYLTAPNQVQLDRENKAPMIENGGDMFSYNPYQYRCCQHNIGFGWPYFAEQMWMATPENGIAAVLYGPSEVKARVGDGAVATFKEVTSYPFDEQVRFELSVDRPARFPLSLRIPEWCGDARVTINGAPRSVPAGAKGWIVLERTWSSGDRVGLDLPMRIRVKKWDANHNSVSVYRGPLAYSLRIEERWRRYGVNPDWSAWEVFPASAWNYGLVVDLKQPEKSFEVSRRAGEPAAQPFAAADAPIVLRGHGRKITEWRAEPNGMVGPLQASPARTSEPEETVELIPMGCARLRISAFPFVGAAGESTAWRNAVPLITASHSTPFDPPTAVHDGFLRTSGADRTIPRFTWGDQHGTTEWIQYTYAAPHRFNWTEIYWVDEGPSGGVYRPPVSWTLLSWDGKAWTPVERIYQEHEDSSRVSVVRFRPVTTTALRLQVQLERNYSAGITEWRAGEGSEAY